MCSKLNINDKCPKCEEAIKFSFSFQLPLKFEFKINCPKCNENIFTLNTIEDNKEEKKEDDVKYLSKKLNIKIDENINSIRLLIKSFVNEYEDNTKTIPKINKFLSKKNPTEEDRDIILDLVGIDNHLEFNDILKFNDNNYSNIIKMISYYYKCQEDDDCISISDSIFTVVYYYCKLLKFN